MRHRVASQYDDTIRRLADTLSDTEIGERVGLPGRAIAKRRYDLGIFRKSPKTGRKKRSIRNEIPVLAKLPTPDDGRIAELVGRWV